MRSWADYDAQYDEPRIDLHCLQCGRIDRAYVVDADHDGEDGHQCLRCARETQARQALLRRLTQTHTTTSEVA